MAQPKTKRMVTIPYELLERMTDAHIVGTLYALALPHPKKMRIDDGTVISLAPYDTWSARAKAKWSAIGKAASPYLDDPPEVTHDAR
jgi:hypothetical protein